MTRVYYFTSDVTVVLITILLVLEIVTMQVVCPFIVQTGDDGLIRVTTSGKLVMRKPFYKL